MLLNHEAIFPRPLSDHLVPTPPPALLPSRIELKGNEVTLEPLNADIHAAALYAAGHGSPEALAIWDYLTYGPWPDLESYKATLRAQSASVDPVFYAIRLNQTGQVCG